MTQRQKSILFVENQPDKIQAIVWLLRDRGYAVEVISDLTEAREALKVRWRHLVVVDVRMIDDQDDHDFSGLHLVTEELDPALRKFVLTSYPTYETATKVLRHFPGQLPPAVDFLSKLEPAENVVQRIIEAIDQRIGINWELNVIYDDALSQTEIADWLCNNSSQDLPPLQSPADYADEIDDLLRLLFPGRNQVVFSPALQGRSNAFVIFARPSAQSEEAHLVVKLGWRKMITDERQNYLKFIEPYSGAVATQIEYAQTLDFAAVAYKLVGGRLERTKRFTDRFCFDTADSLTGVVSQLFTETLDRLYSLKPSDSSRYIDELYRERMRLDVKSKSRRLADNLERLAEQATNLGVTAWREDTTHCYRWPNGIQVNSKMLRDWIFNTRQVAKAACLHEMITTSPVHGDLNGDNILVDAIQNTWLIDFGRTGYGYPLCDFAELESVIALDLLSQHAVDDVLMFEAILFSQRSWESDLDLSGDTEPLPEATELIKALTIIQRIRRMARKWQQDDGGLQRYYLALLFEAALRLMGKGFDSPAQPPKLDRLTHALLRIAIAIRVLNEA